MRQIATNLSGRRPIRAVYYASRLKKCEFRFSLAPLRNKIGTEVTVAAVRR
jgi:hypothetical protein